MDSRIDPCVQSALMRMCIRGGDQETTANAIVAAIKRGALGGVYRHDSMTAAQYARTNGINWWSLMESSEAVSVTNSSGKAPIMVFRATARPSDLEDGLMAAWPRV